jgi:hypothetical protein
MSFEIAMIWNDMLHPDNRTAKYTQVLALFFVGAQTKPGHKFSKKIPPAWWDL